MLVIFMLYLLILILHNMDQLCMLFVILSCIFMSIIILVLIEGRNLCFLCRWGMFLCSSRRSLARFGGLGSGFCGGDRNLKGRLRSHALVLLLIAFLLILLKPFLQHCNLFCLFYHSKWIIWIVQHLQLRFSLCFHIKCMVFDVKFQLISKLLQ